MGPAGILEPVRTSSVRHGRGVAGVGGWAYRWPSKTGDAQIRYAPSTRRSMPVNLGVTLSETKPRCGPPQHLHMQREIHAWALAVPAKASSPPRRRCGGRGCERADLYAAHVVRDEAHDQYTNRVMPRQVPTATAATRAIHRQIATSMSARASPTSSSVCCTDCRSGLRDASPTAFPLQPDGDLIGDFALYVQTPQCLCLL